MGNKLYLIGFFYADGCLHKQTKKHKHSLSVTLSNKDYFITDNFKKLFGGCTYQVRSGKYSRWFLSSSNLYKELENFGLTPRKTYTLKMPKLKYYKDFIRGYFDGDGSVYLSQHNTIMSEFWGTKEFLNSISQILGDEIDPIMNVKVSKGKRKTYRLRYNQTQSLLLYRWMYGDNCLCLKRKRSRFENGINRVMNLKRTRFIWTKHEDNIIKTSYKILGADGIVDKLLFKRTKQAIIQRASKLLTS